jgi:hypothetical protein
MYSIKLDWKKIILSGTGTEQDPYVYGDDYSVSMEDVEAWMKANVGTYYVGNQSASKLELWFSQEPDQADKDAIQAYWDGITEVSSEATNYVAQSAIDSAIDSAKASLQTKIENADSYDTFTAAEKKLAAGLTPTKAELGL